MSGTFTFDCDELRTSVGTSEGGRCCNTTVRRNQNKTSTKSKIDCGTTGDSFVCQSQIRRKKVRGTKRDGDVVLEIYHRNLLRFLHRLRRRWTL